MGGTARSGRLSTWLCLLLCAAAAGWLVSHLAGRVSAEGFHLVDPARIRIDAEHEWFDPLWREELALCLAGTPPFEAGDVAARDALAARVGALSFVAEVGELEPVWPDGLRLLLRLREPVACVTRGGGFQPIAADGTLLSGRWVTPPAYGTGWLPVLEPGEGGALALHRALAVASSLWRHLDPVSLTRLGRIVIDASDAEVHTPEDTGVLLELEDQRCVLFGRSPADDEPGELPVDLKWDHVAAALDFVARGDPRSDWLVLDARWDRAEVELVNGAAGGGR